jgi:hypothetical protein
MKRPPPAPEIDLHIPLVNALTLFLMPGWMFFHYPAGEHRDPITGARLKRMGTKRGVADILLVGPPAGRFHALELKARGRKPTPEQLAFLEAVAAAGGHSAWVDTLKDALEVLWQWGAIREVSYG